VAQPSLFDRIADATLLEQAIRDIGTRLRARGAQWVRAQEGVPVALMEGDARELARAIERDLRAGSYTFSPAELRVAELDKRRALIVPVLTDLVVFHAVARVLTDRIEAKLPETLFSFRRGRSPIMAHRALASFVGEHVAARPDPRLRGLYVLKRDVRSYTESIDVTEGSRLWPLLEDCIGEPLGQTPLGRLVTSVVRPTLAEGGKPAARGVHAGSPITPVVANVYLLPLDRALGAIGGAFYGRFGDDFLFASADPRTSRQAETVIEDVLGSLELCVHPDKRRNYFFNGAGRPSPEEGFRGSPALEWLGMRAGFDGKLGLTAEKETELLREVTRRARSAFAHAVQYEPAEAMRLVCKTTNEALSSRHAFAVLNAGLLGSVCTDFVQLRRLDWYVAAAVASTLSGRRAPECFRSVPYRRLRREGGLVSLVQARRRRFRGT